MLPFVDSLSYSLSLSLVAGKRRLFNCLEGKIAVSASLSLSASSCSPFSFEAKLQFGRTVIFRSCRRSKRKTCFSVFVSLGECEAARETAVQWLLRDSVLTPAQLMRKFTRNVVVARVVYATMSAII